LVQGKDPGVVEQKAEKRRGHDAAAAHLISAQVSELLFEVTMAEAFSYSSLITVKNRFSFRFSIGV
jgi:hypothetical protein